MVRSDTVSLTVKAGLPPPPSGWVKTADLVIGFIRFPFVSNSAIIDALIPKAQEEIQQHNASLANPRIRGATVISEELVLDVYEPPPTSPSPIAWALLVFVLLAIATGALTALCIVLYLRVISLEKTLAEVGKTIEETIAEKEAALAAGKISEEYAKSLNEKLQEAKTKSEEAGVADWWAMLEKVIGYMPLILVFVFVLAIAGMLPRPRREE